MHGGNDSIMYEAAALERLALHTDGKASQPPCHFSVVHMYDEVAGLLLLDLPPGAPIKRLKPPLSAIAVHEVLVGVLRSIKVHAPSCTRD